MTITTPVHPDVRKDEQVDRRVDVQIDGRKAVGKDGLPGAFVIVLANHKGGVTKTTSTANLAAMLAEAGRRVLIVDCDPQANLSEAFGWYADIPGERLEDLLENPDAADRYAPPLALQPDVMPELPWRERLRIIPSTDALADVAADLPVTAGPGHELRLRQVLEPLRDSFDLILLDTPPGLGTLSGIAVLAADGLLIPALAADLDVRGASKLYDLVEGEIPGLRILGRADRRERAALADHQRRSAADGRGRDARAAGACTARRARGVGAALPRSDRRAGARVDGQPCLPPARRSSAPGARAMSSPQPMPSARRRPIPGMVSEPIAPPPPNPTEADQLVAGAEAAATSVPPPLIPDEPPDASRHGRAEASEGTGGALPAGRRERRPAADYASTRLVNFRIPVDLHDRFRGLVREAEVRHPRLRRPSLTELVIALLEEGPQTADEVAELIRRKRAAEHERALNDEPADAVDSHQDRRERGVGDGAQVCKEVCN